MYNIVIEDGEKTKCPNCNSVIMISNGTEKLYRNITLIHFVNQQPTRVKCKQCKEIIEI